MKSPPKKGRAPAGRRNQGAPKLTVPFSDPEHTPCLADVKPSTRPAREFLEGMRDLAGILIAAPASLQDRWWERITLGWPTNAEFERQHLLALVGAAETVLREAERDGAAAKRLAGHLAALRGDAQPNTGEDLIDATPKK